MWIEIIRKHGMYATDERQEPQGSCGLKFGVQSIAVQGTTSGAARLLWIEIVTVNEIYHALTSGAARLLWIEILSAIYILSATSSGAARLLWIEILSRQHPPMISITSGAARLLWIEIIVENLGVMGVPRQEPQGSCGLKW